MQQDRQSKLIEDIAVDAAAQIRGGWWGYHLQGLYPYLNYTSSCTNTCGVPSNTYGYGYGAPTRVNQSVDINFTVD